MKQLYDENPGLSRVSEGIQREKPGYYAVIPAEVRYDKSVPANAKLLYGEISALIGPEGYCYASNQYFAELYGVTEETISRQITRLEKSGHIFRELIKDQDGQIIQRKIFLRVSARDGHTAAPPIDEKINTSPQNNQEGIDEKVKETNLSITNNKKKNKKEKNGDKLPELELEEIAAIVAPWYASVDPDGRHPELCRLILELYSPRVFRKGSNPPVKSERGLNDLFRSLERYDSPERMMEALNLALARGYTSVIDPGRIRSKPSPGESVKNNSAEEAEVWL